VEQSGQKNSNLSLSDSIGLLALVFAFFAFVVDPSPVIKFALLCCACVSSAIFVWISHWTFRWSRLVKLFTSLIVCVVIWGNSLIRVSKQIPTFGRVVAVGKRVWISTHSPAAHLFEAATAGALSMLFLLLLIGVVVAAVKSQKSRPNGAKGFLDYKLETETAIGELPQKMVPITAIIGEVGIMLGKAAKNTNSTPSSETRAHLRAITVLSHRLDGLTRRLVVHCNSLESTAQRYSEGVTGWSAWIEQQAGQSDASKLLLSSSSQFGQSILGAMHQTDEYLKGLDSIRGVSQALNGAVERHVLQIIRVRATLQELLKCSDSVISTLGAGIEGDPA
jgi:hypothetical protein